MGAALRFLALAALALALAPSGALGATVDRDAGTGVITIVDDVDAADDILVSARRDARHRQPRRRAG